MTFAGFNNEGTDGVGKLYLDGKLRGTMTGRRQIFTWDPSKVLIRVGINYIGLYDDLAIFNRALNDAEVQALHDLPEGATLELDGGTWQVLETSGHSPGGRSLYCPEEQVVIVGDALFAGGIGRYDFHHSDGPQLMRNLQQKLMTLPDETRVLPGHGPSTTIGTERQTNPFLNDGL